jgi:primary-amine oxidase
MYQVVMRTLVIVAMLGIFSVNFSTVQPLLAQGGPPCSAPFAVDITFTNGARWDFCWEERALEGIVLRMISFTPPGGPRRLVLYQASLAEVFIPYDDGAPRFHDLTGFGLGNSNMNNLTSAECPGGVLRQNRRKNVLCLQVSGRGYAYKSFAGQKQGQRLNLFSTSNVGNYFYIIGWQFNDNGVIQPSAQATGHLYNDTSNAAYGWPLSNGAARYSTSHVHNYYWRLDFDLNGSWGDRVEQFDFGGAGAALHPMIRTTFANETKQQIAPTNLRFWRVYDPTTVNPENHPISYEIETLAGHAHRGSEPWSHNDIYVTNNNGSEQLAADPARPTNNVNSFVNGQAINDVVLWVGVTFHHVPRDEDEDSMHPHWSGFNLIPRDWTAKSYN